MLAQKPENEQAMMYETFPSNISNNAHFLQPGADPLTLRLSIPLEVGTRRFPRVTTHLNISMYARLPLSNNRQPEARLRQHTCLSHISEPA